MDYLIPMLLIAYLWKVDLETSFKISYYQQKLKNRDIEDTVKNMTFFDIWRLK